jgi:hypothetical protein
MGEDELAAEREHTARLTEALAHNAVCPRCAFCAALAAAGEEQT